MTGDAQNMVEVITALAESPLVKFLAAVPLLVLAGAMLLVLVDTVRRAR